ncbi:MAG TPA: transcription elongation factor 1 family protein [Candidatus Dormibacteraeota bacterium]|jgi:transcription elongation factor Elf1|nr:transcription elongation factor 1 family protein [Candidatus Dormibacteraeota bacterium]
MGRRRRRVVRIVKKKLPTVFICPRCGEEAVRVTIAKDTGHATVLCALCNLKDDFPAHPAAQAIDVYSYFTDKFYGVKEPRAIIPHDRDVKYIPSEDEPEEETAQPSIESAPQPPSPVETEKPEMEPSMSEPISPAETTGETAGENVQAESTQVDSAETASETPVDQKVQSEKESEEENEPFADILENKDKKRYSSTPLPQQTSEQTS